MVPTNKYSVTRAEWPALSIALAATVVIHLAVASGVIWGGWLDGGAGMESPQPSEMILNIDLAANPAAPASTQNKEIANPEPILTQSAHPIPQISPPKLPTPKPDSGLRLSSFLKPDIANFRPADPTHPTGRFSKNNSPVRRPTPISSDGQPTFSARPQVMAASRPAPSARSIGPLPGAPSGPIKTRTFVPAPIPPAPLPKPLKPEEKPKPATPLKPAPPAQFQLTGQLDYDTRFIQDVLKAWMQYKGRPQWAEPGKVVASFRLHHDGSITDLSFTSRGANQRQRYYCREALEGTAPFQRWTKALRNRIGADHRQCQFTFRYVNQ